MTGRPSRLRHAGMTQPDETRAAGTLPAEGAFVLQLESGTSVAGGRLSGRVEHVVSGRVARFRSLHELLGFVARALEGPRAPASEATPPATGPRPRRAPP